VFDRMRYTVLYEDFVCKSLDLFGIFITTQF